MKKEVGMPDLVKNEEKVLEFWKGNNIFEKVKEKNRGSKKYYAFLDGPITANNEMKLHHVWNRALKDIMLRYKALNGYDAHYQNGFDAQGLWVEVGVEKALGLKDKRDILSFGIDRFTEECIARVNKFANKITEQSIRLGQWMDWDNSYFTNSDENITAIWYFLKRCNEKGWLIEKFRPMPWCSHCGTSLSEHELADSYMEMEHMAVFFKLPIKNTDMDMLVWTTTPWTLSSNVAIAVNPELDYAICKVKSSNRKLVVGKQALKVLKDDLIEIVKEIKGKELVGKTYETCFEEFPEQQFEHKIVEWESVDALEGSGAVHIAPGCGAEDFELGQKLGLKNVCPVDENGIFYKNFGFLSGKDATDVADIIFDELKKRNKLYYTHKYKHRYPICWRCKKPLIFRLTKEWYIKADEIRPQLIKAVDTVEWQPEFLKKRMLDWLNNMGDWNISRKRFYGLPLPFYRCEKCGELIVVGSLEELKALSSAKEVESLPHLHRPYIDKIKVKCKCGHEVSRVTEVGDCWLDAGITSFSTKKYFTDKKFWEKNFPIDCVVEMKEQIRLWFYSLLFMSVTLENRAPYKKVIGFAMLVAEDGSKFSKSGPNNINFDELVDKTGADVLRYVFAANNMMNDTRFGFGITDDIKRKLFGLWNAYVFFNTYAIIDNPKLDGFNPDIKSFDITDKWLLEETNKLIIFSKDCYDNHRYFMLIKAFEDYIDNLTNWYIRVNRRRYWKSEDEEDKLNAYWSLYNAIKTVCRVMSPILPFMTEYIWQNMVREIEGKAEESIFLAGFPETFKEGKFKDLDSKTKDARDIITIAQRLRNENQIKIKQPLKTMFLNVKPEAEEAVREFENIIKDELNIKKIVFEKNNNRFNDEFLSVNFKTAGQVLKGDVQKVKNILAESSNVSMKKYADMYKQGKVTIGDFKDLSADLFVLNYKAKNEYVIATENEKTIVLDITIDKDLLIEGLSRELIRQIQVLRKEANFKVEERISISLSTESETLKEVIKTYFDRIKTEVLAKEIVDEINNPTLKTECEIGEEKITISLKN